jgi:ABC-type glycerol-3-phosphate transport system substrate-binding protein
MKSMITFMAVVAVLALAACSVDAAKDAHTVHALDQMPLTIASFDTWRAERGNRDYTSDSDEYDARFAAWVKCMEFVQPVCECVVVSECRGL